MRYLYSHKTFMSTTPFGISISKGLVSAGITLTSKASYTGYPGNHGGIGTCS